MGEKTPNASGKGEHPVACDHFVCPPEVQSVFGEKPRSLRIVIPVEDDEKWCPQYYRLWSMTQGKVCQGDGAKARRKIDAVTGKLANHTTTKIEWREQLCLGRDCPDYGPKGCGEQMNLQFLLPEVNGAGTWQIDTGSINSIRNINSAASFLRQIYGHIDLIPLVLSMEQTEVNNPDDGKKKTVWVLKLGTTETIYDIAKNALDFTNRLKITGTTRLKIADPDESKPDNTIEGEYVNVDTGEIVDTAPEPSLCGIIAGDVIDNPQGEDDKLWDSLDSASPKNQKNMAQTGVKDNASAKAASSGVDVKGCDPDMCGFVPMSLIKRVNAAKAWSTVSVDIQKTYGVTGATAYEKIAKLPKEQASHFMQQCEDRIAAAGGV